MSSAQSNGSAATRARDSVARAEVALHLVRVGERLVVLAREGLHQREIAAALAVGIETRRIDIAHGYEWPPGLECYLACRGNPNARAVTTVMSMAVAPFIPHPMHLSVGTEQIAALERASGRSSVSVIEPPVDTVENRPGSAADIAMFRATWHLDDGLPTVLCVTRLAHQLKLEGLLTAIDAIETLDQRLRVRLLIVGDGEARNEVEMRAHRVNQALGRSAVVLTGEITDPRPAYDLADVCIGMGGSALRSMSFAKPLIVQGEGGFFRLLTPETLATFLWTGWYGHGNGNGDPVGELRQLLFTLLSDQPTLRTLGAFGRSVIEDRFSLPAAADRQLEMYAAALQQPHQRVRRIPREVSASASFARYLAVKRTHRLLGYRAVEDFNAQPVARAGPDRDKIQPTTVRSANGPIVYFAGVSWDAIAGTDRHLASALAESQPIVWVDPPMSWVARRRHNIKLPTHSIVGPDILRLSTSCPPGVSRPILRHIAQLLAGRQARKALAAVDLSGATIIVSTPGQLLPKWGKDAVRIYYETDDFVAGAALLGSSERFARKVRAVNTARSDIVMGVTEILTEKLNHRDGVEAVTLSNGTDVEHFRQTKHVESAADVELTPPIAGVVGQLNERLDLSMLEAVADQGTSLLLLGPRRDVQAETRLRLDNLIARTNVQWIDQQPFDRLPSFFAALDVGLTPYSPTEFNLASFPLKTLEYIAAGLPVVSSDLPAARALDTDLVMLATTPTDFAKAVDYLLERPPATETDDRRRTFVETHSWAARATQLTTIIDDVRCAKRGAQQS